jgi:hypothetical protein
MPRSGAKIKAGSNRPHHIIAMKHESGKTVQRVNPKRSAIKGAGSPVANQAFFCSIWPRLDLVLQKWDGNGVQLADLPQAFSGFARRVWSRPVPTLLPADGSAACF